MGWGISVLDGVLLYWMGYLYMGWGFSIRDGVLVYGMVVLVYGVWC